VPEPLRRTPLTAHHEQSGAKLAPFAGWSMPVSFEGVLAEHRAVRERVGVFDVSHLGTVWVTGPAATRTLDRSFTADATALDDGTSRYTLCTAEDGGILDDLIIYRLAEERWMVVPNAANTAAVLSILSVPDLAAGENGPCDDGMIGYVVAVADTRGFVDWYESEWAPGFRARHPRPGPMGRDYPYSEEALVRDGGDPGRMLRGITPEELAQYPAHLHIDLLPQGQRRGLGRRLLDTLRAALAERGVPGVHLGMDPANTGARAFYDAYGFRELPSHRPDTPLLGISTR
jgi:ribosomal protein S18 acetylase RimI-like enzyme